jgi:adenine-specific DNA glycosylase
MSQEPVMTLIVSLIAASGALLAAFGVEVTPEQIAALSTFAVAAIGLGLWVRSRVTPTCKLAPAREDVKAAVRKRQP